jgi:hypothetical protein
MGDRLTYHGVRPGLLGDHCRSRRDGVREVQGASNATSSERELNGKSKQSSTVDPQRVVHAVVGSATVLGTLCTRLYTSGIILG